jgi:hypothetical protein
MKVQVQLLAAAALLACTTLATVASAAETCSRFVPSAGLTVAVPCVDQGAPAVAPAAPAAAPAVTVAALSTASTVVDETKTAAAEPAPQPPAADAVDEIDTKPAPVTPAALAPAAVAAKSAVRTIGTVGSVPRPTGSYSTPTANLGRHAPVTKTSTVQKSARSKRPNC